MKIASSLYADATISLRFFNEYVQTWNNNNLIKKKKVIVYQPLRRILSSPVLSPFLPSVFPRQFVLYISLVLPLFVHVSRNGKVEIALRHQSSQEEKKKKISKNAHNSKMVCLAEQDNRHHRNRNVSLKGTSPIQRRQCFIPLHPLLCHALYCPFEEYFQITDVNSFGAFEFQLYPVSEQQGRSFPQVHEPNQ